MFGVSVDDNGRSVPAQDGPSCPLDGRDAAAGCDQNPLSPQPDPDVIETVTRWFRNGLPCLAGRREFNRLRYMVRVGQPGQIRPIIAEFEAELVAGRVTACFIAFAPPQKLASEPASSMFRWLADAMSVLSDMDGKALSSGAALSLVFTLECPVTGEVTCFDDFECIAFCPQSAELLDPLYDPLMYAPVPAVNISSDVYAFSVFVRDACRTAFGVSPRCVSDRAALFDLFHDCARRWHALAIRTIDNFAATVPDPQRCPVHVTPDRLHWVACHRDPAFAENVKVQHVHELPALYADRICDAWIAHFTQGRTYSASGLARPGFLSGEDE